MTKPLSASEAITFLRCAREWKYKYIDNLQLEDIDAFKFGRAFHETLDKGFTKENLSEDNLNVIQCMIEEYKHATEFLAPVIEREHRFYFKDEKGNQLATGVIDAIRQCSTTGRWWITEIKTASKIDQFKMDTIENDIQSNFYIINVGMLPYDHKLFQGISYEVITKSMKPQVFIKNIPFTPERASTFAINFGLLYAFMRNVNSEYKFDLPNVNSCMRYGQKCPFFNRCYQ
jgi:hypothetical protein